MTEVKFNISTQEYNNLLDKNIEIEQILTGITQKSDEQGKKVNRNVCFELESLHRANGGAPSVDEFEITDAIFDPDNKKGKVWLNYTVNLYYGCSDQNSNNNLGEVVDFEVNLEEKTIIFRFHEVVFRDTYEEF